MNDSKTILCVEDNADSLELLQFVLSYAGFEAVSCATSTESLQLAEEKKFSAIILENHLENTSGLEICRRIRSYDKKTPIIFFTCLAYPKDREAGLAAGANEYLVKPNDFERIVETVKRLIL